MTRSERTFLLRLVFSCLLAGNSFAQNSAGFEQRYNEAQQELSAGNYVAAETGFEKLAQEEPDMAELHANLGLVYFQEKKFLQAIPEFRRALQLKPALADSRFFLAMSLSELGDYKEAVPGLEKGFHSLHPGMARQCGLQLERAYTALNRDRDAVQVALELDRLYPNDPEVLYHNGKILGNFAFLSMQRLSQVAPGSVWRHEALAEAAESQNSFDVAMSEYRQVLALDPHRPGIHYRLGRTLLARARQTASSDDLAAAEGEFEKELEINPQNENAAYELAEVHRNAGQLAESEKLFEQALRLHPDFEEAQLGLASVLMSEQKPREALPHLQMAIKLDPENEVAWYRLSQLQRNLGNDVEAKQDFAKFQELHQQKANREEAGKRFLTPDEVTKQQLDAQAPQ